jgi:hypothetical protein
MTDMFVRAAEKQKLIAPRPIALVRGQPESRQQEISVRYIRPSYVAVLKFIANFLPLE